MTSLEAKKLINLEGGKMNKSIILPKLNILLGLLLVLVLVILLLI